MFGTKKESRSVGTASIAGGGANLTPLPKMKSQGTYAGQTVAVLLLLLFMFNAFEVQLANLGTYSYP